MTVLEQVQQAKTPREALLIIAAAVDQLRQAHKAVDPWAGWDEEEIKSTDGSILAATLGAETRAMVQEIGEHEVTNSRVLDSNGHLVDRHEVTDDEVISWIGKNYGRTPTDDSEGKALIAMVRADLERAGKGEMAPADFVMHDGVIESSIDFSPPDEAYSDRRYKFAAEVLQLDMALGEHPEPDGDWAADYAKQGPLPLYIINRDLVIQYPDGVKAAMIADVNNFSTKIAYEMGADLLKQPMTNNRDNPAMAGSWTYDRDQGFVS